MARGPKLVYVASSTNQRVASYRMASDTVKLWERSGFRAALAHMRDIPGDGDAYVFCKHIPSERPRPDAMVALHMHDLWDGEQDTLDATLAQLSSSHIDVVVPCSRPYEDRLAELNLAPRVAWCPESPVPRRPPPARHPPQEGPFRVGFHGTGSTFRFLSGNPARGLERVARKLPVELVVLSNFPRQVTEQALKDTLRLRRVRVRYVPWTAEGHMAEMCSWDVAVLPASHGSDYALIKSCNRLREAAQHGVPVVAQRGNPDMEWFSDGGKNCPLAADADEWYKCVRRMLRYRGTRNSFSSRTGRRLMAVYGDKPVMERWKAVFDLL